MLVDRLNQEMWLDEYPKDDPIKKEYGSIWMNLSLHYTGLVVLNNERILVPKSQRNEIICELHRPHTGIDYSIRQGRRDYYWPHLEKDITRHVKECQECIKHLPSQPRQPVIHQNKATYPMEVVGMDLFDWEGLHHLVIADQFSGYIYVQRLASMTTTNVKRAMGYFFNLFGNPYWVISDNGRQLTSGEYENFLRKRGSLPIHSSPYYPQSNGLAESAVKISKTLLDQCKGDWQKFDVAFAQWRDVPNACGYTPAEIFLARRIRGSLPILPGKTSLNVPAAEEGAEARKILRQEQYKKLRSKNLRALNIGDTVHVQETTGKNRGKWKPNEAIITGIHRDGRSYEVTMSNGHKSSRNRKFLRPALKKHEENPDNELATDPIPDPVHDDDIINANHESGNECIESDEEAGDIQNAPDIPVPLAEPEPAPVRRSPRINKGINCHSCTGCCGIRDYLRKINQL